MTPEPQDVPFVTVILPVRNEASFLVRSLSAVLCQDYDRDKMEVIVADGMSTDGTRDIVRSFQANDSRVRIVDNTGRIAPTGLNVAMREAKGEIIVRVDGHCEVQTDYVRRCVTHITGDRFDGVGGPVETIGETPIAATIAVAMSSPFGVGNSAFRTSKNTTDVVDTIAFPAYTRDVINRAGPYDEQLIRNQDDDYNYRLRAIGAKLLLAGDVRSKYYSRGSLRSLWRQYYQYGYWKVRVLQKQPLEMRARQFVPPTFVAVLLLNAFIAFFSTYARWTLLLVLGCYACCNVAAAVVTNSRKRVDLPLILPIVFATLHFAYGLGFLRGLIAFRKEWTFRRKKHPQTYWLPVPRN